MFDQVLLSIIGALLLILVRIAYDIAKNVRSIDLKVAGHSARIENLERANEKIESKIEKLQTT